MAASVRTWRGGPQGPEAQRDGATRTGGAGLGGVVIAEPAAGRPDLDDLLDAAVAHPSLAGVQHDSYAELLITSAGGTSTASLREMAVELRYPRGFQGIELAGPRRS
jgi:hypothetical protein